MQCKAKELSINKYTQQSNAMQSNAKAMQSNAKQCKTMQRKAKQNKTLHVKLAVIALDTPDSALEGGQRDMKGGQINFKMRPKKAF